MQLQVAVRRDDDTCHVVSNPMQKRKAALRDTRQELPLLEEESVILPFEEHSWGNRGHLLAELSKFLFSFFDNADQLMLVEIDDRVSLQKLRNGLLIIESTDTQRDHIGEGWPSLIGSHMSQ